MIKSKVIYMAIALIVLFSGCGSKLYTEYPECEFSHREYGEWQLINSQVASKDHQQMLSIDGYEITNEFSATISVDLIETVNLELGYNFSISSLKCAGTSTYIDKGQMIDFYCRPVYEVYNIVEVRYSDERKKHEIERKTIEFGQLRAAEYGWIVYDEYKNIIEDTRNNPILVDENGEIVEVDSDNINELESSNSGESGISEETQENQEILQEESSEKTENEDKTIEITEQHTPNDVATSVSLPAWNVDEDYGIDGKRYGGGVKVIISDMFTSLGSGLDNEITSRIMIPISNELQSYPDDEKRFTGVFVLDQSMYGSRSSGTIRILINNEEMFSTGEINGETLIAFPYDVSYAGADSIIIETNTTLRGTSFVFGIVVPKE